MSVQDWLVIRGSAPDHAGSPDSGWRGRGPTLFMNDDDPQDLATDLATTLARLRQEHRDLDVAIEALARAPGHDLLQVQRLKKRKLQLRDRIIQVEDQITPDIIA